MPFIGVFTLEFCDTATEDVSLEQVLQAARTGPMEGDWFLTLTKANEDFIDFTVNEDKTLHVVCDEDNERLICESVDPALIEDMLTSFYDHTKGWKRMCAWHPPRKKGLLERLFS